MRETSSLTSDEIEIAGPSTLSDEVEAASPSAFSEDSVRSKQLDAALMTGNALCLGDFHQEVRGRFPVLSYFESGFREELRRGNLSTGLEAFAIKALIRENFVFILMYNKKNENARRAIKQHILYSPSLATCGRIPTK
ncbi:hypothetical protein [Coriobacterium glomerans]|uniref:hypothetical protein n=1 Tax=Coriobacterium glomerans TaxID=33871 RepID=UPI00155A1665|nr:hypothetical protein [Coriobacterium glomerans]